MKSDTVSYEKSDLLIHRDISFKRNFSTKNEKEQRTDDSDNDNSDLEELSSLNKKDKNSHQECECLNVCRFRSNRESS